MAHIIISIPDTDKYIIFSTITDTILMKDINKEEVIKYELDYSIEVTKKRTKTCVTKAIEKLQTIPPRVSYIETLEMDKNNR